MVVVAIIAVSAAVAIPAVQAGRHQREVRQTLQHFVAAIREASSKAVLQRQTVELWIRKDDNAYELALPLKNTDGSATGEEAAASEGAADLDELERAERRNVVGRVQLPSSASFGDVHGGRSLSDDIIAFPFSPTGGSCGGEIELVFEQDRSSKSYVIAFDPLVSAIELKEGGS